MPFHTNHNIRLAAASLLALLLSSYLFANNGHAEELREISKVNGGIEIDDGAEIDSAETINGGIRVDDNVISRRSLETTNGDIRVRKHRPVDRVVIVRVRQEDVRHILWRKAALR